MEAEKWIFLLPSTWRMGKNPKGRETPFQSKGSTGIQRIKPKCCRLHGADEISPFSGEEGSKASTPKLTTSQSSTLFCEIHTHRFFFLLLLLFFLFLLALKLTPTPI